MIPDKNTNHLYLSDRLESDYPNFFKNFKKGLDQYNIVPEYLPDTKDVWCVDFMPIQINESDFVQFKYYPTYLRTKKLEKTISDTSLICKQINLSPLLTDIIADGGNVTKSNNKVIMTTRVITENPQYSIKELTDKLTDLLQIDQLILIPEQPKDFTGHSDGMVRFIDNDTVLINDYSKEQVKDFQLHLKIALHNAGLDIIEIPTSVYDNVKYDDATGDYINYLQMEGIIFVPTFKRKEDDKVIRQFEDIFSDTTIVPVESNELSKDGGIINCVTWNIKK
jgi:agmatine deiminase